MNDQNEAMIASSKFGDITMKKMAISVIAAVLVIATPAYAMSGNPDQNQRGSAGRWEAGWSWWCSIYGAGNPFGYQKISCMAAGAPGLDY